MIELRATVIEERRLACGCAVVLCSPAGIDDQSGRFVTATEIVLVPCAREGHLVLARLAAQNVGVEDVEALAIEMERLLDPVVPDIDLAHAMKSHP